MVLLTITPTILSAIKASPFALEPPIDPPEKSLGDPISHEQIVGLSRIFRLQAENGAPYTLASLLRGSKVYIPPPPPKPTPSAEYLALKASLLAAQEQQTYELMLSNKSLSLLSPLEASSRDHDDVTPSLVINIFLSILLCGFAVFWATRYWASAPARVGLSFAAGIVVGIAEVGVYMGYLRRVRLSREAEAKKRKRVREVKSVVEGGSWRTEVRSGKKGGEIGKEIGKEMEGEIRKRR